MRSQHFKRCLALLLSLALIITAMPVQAFATDAIVPEAPATLETEADDNVPSTSDAKTYTITFYADKEMKEVLQKVTVAEGETPEPVIPVKAPDEYYRYEFTGWNRPLNPAYLDENYYANWKAVEQFTVTFYNWDGNEVLEKPLRVDKGTDLTTYPDVPTDVTRPSDDEFDYTFTGWDPALSTSLTKDENYTAQYEATKAIVNINVTFAVGSNGTYTVNGNPLTEKTQIETTTSERDFVLKATPDAGYEFLGWYSGSNYISGDAEYTYRATTKKVTITPKFMKQGTAKFMVDGNMYAGLNNAITAAQKDTSDGVMVLKNDVTLQAGTYRIPEGVTLVIPHDETGKAFRKTPGVADEEWVEPKPYCTLTLAKGANLIVDGELSVTALHTPGAGGRVYGGAPHKTYGHIATEEGGSISISKGGALYAYGYITGKGSVTAQSGATVYEYFQITDFRGGSATTDMLTTGEEYAVLPVNQYYVQNVEIPMTIEAGATEYCYTSLKMSGNIISAAVGFIGEGDDKMFKLNAGSITKSYDGSRDRLIAEINGDLGISPIVVKGGGNTIDSKRFVLPINSNISIYVNSGSISMSQDVALIPGTELVIAKGASCTLNEDCSIYVYDQDTWGNFCTTGPTLPFRALAYAPGRTYTRTEADLKDAIVQVDGTLDATKGYLYTTKGGANIFSTGEGKIVLRKGTEEYTYQFEYKGPSTSTDAYYPYYGIYHEIEIDPAVLQNGNGTAVTQDAYADRGIINYIYKNGEWVVEGHIIVIDDGYDATCNTPGLTESQYCNFPDCPEHTIPAKEIEPLGHDWKVVPAKNPTYTSVGWNEHHACNRCTTKDTDYKEIAKLEGAAMLSYDEFIENLEILEQWANDYVKTNPGKDPLALVIKYIRTGVDRYNSGSWNIMAGYEDPAFASYVAQREDALNVEAAEKGEPLLKVSGLKNIENFTLNNGDHVDFGHMFGTMDITYHNNFSVNHADVAGWAGDTVDLLSLADQFGVGDAKTVNEMADYIYKNYLLKETSDLEKEFGEDLKEGSFSLVDMIGDLDGYYIMDVLSKKDYENGTLTDVVKEYFAAELTEESRAKYFLENRFDDISLREDLRNEVYREVTDNPVINTLEATREFETEDLNTLRKACCYAFADYICRQAGDYVDALENPFISVFSSTFSTLAPGITKKVYKAKTADGLQTDYYTATIDITRDDVQVFANYNENDPSKGWAMSRVIDQANAAQNKYGNPESEQYIENYNVIASINGDGYNMSTGEPGGLLVMNGQEYHPIGGGGFFAILDDGTAKIGSMSDYNNGYKDRIKEAIGGFGTMLVKDGKVCITATSDYYTNRAARTAIGITKTGKVVFMVMDGRQGQYTCGGSMEEIAQVMLDAGCETAINLDGGGSSTFVVREEGAESLTVANKPSDGVSRSVSTSLFAVSTAPSSTTFDHAVLTSNYGYLTVNSSVQLTAAGVSATNNKVDLPEGTTWAVADPSMGTIDENGVFTAKANGDAEIRLMLDKEIVGETTLHVVTPDNLYFKKTSTNAVYGDTVAIPVNAVYNNKNVAINANDIVFTLSDERAGKFDGLNFVAAESQLKTVKITAGLPNNESVAAVFTVYLYNEGEASFDFDKALGGDPQFAWNRIVSNAVTEDTVLYSATGRGKEMTTSYTFAIDMSKLDIPDQLAPLTYMLPGSDMEGASAWSFLCQLAERMSDMTEVSAKVQFDEDVDVDVSDLTLMNDYFKLTGKEYDPETNTVTVKLNWIKQDKPIELEQANPVCILSGIKITPKKNAAWTAKEQLSIVNSGEVSYSVYMRANGLYTFSQNPSNQEVYGLTPFVNPNKESERGGKFSSVYKTFTDSYTLDKSIKNGWVGTRYYEEGEMYTGIRYVKEDKLYYNFGKNGSNTEGPYTGEMSEKGKEYYVVNGEIFKKGASVWNDAKDTGWIRFGLNDWRYYDPATGVRVNVTIEETARTCIIPTMSTLTTETGLQKIVWADDAGGHEYVEKDGKHICSVCGWQRVKMEDCIISLSADKVTYNGEKKLPVVTAVNPITGDVLVRSGDFNDYKRAYTDNVDVGTATVTLTARKHGYYVNINEWRGNYSDQTTVTFTILPDRATNVKADVYGTYANLSWDAAKVAETDTEDNVTKYVIYCSENGGEWKKVATTKNLSYKVKNLEKGNSYKFRIATKKVGTDGETYTSSKYANAEVDYKYFKADAVNAASTGKIVLSWNKVSTSKKFEVYRATGKNGEFTMLKKVKGTSYTDTSSEAGKSYTYKVKDLKTGKFSTVAVRTCDLKRPVVTARNVASSGKIKLTWKAVDGAQKYEIYRATSKNGTYKKMKTTTGVSYVNTSATAGKTYYYKVKAIAKKSAANSAYSVVDTRTCDLKRPVVTAESAKKKQVTLTWKNVENAQKYEIYRATSKGGTYKKIAATTNLSYTNKFLTSNKTYYYKVKAIAENTAANSVYSLVKSVKVR